MINKSQALQVLDDQRAVLTRAGEQLGPVVRIFLDDFTDWPSFCTVDLAAPSTRETYVALHEAELVQGDIVVPYSRQQVADAPQVEQDQDLSITAEDQLFDYYGVPMEGVVPIVANLGTALGTDDSGDLTETRVDH